MVLRANELFLQYDYLYEDSDNKCPIYSPRDVIVIKDYEAPLDSQLFLAIILGAIGYGELRTDWNGMVSYDDIVRHATWEDLDNPDFRPLMENREVEEVSWYCLDQMRHRREGVHYAFDTYSQCMRYLNHKSVPRPTLSRLDSKPDPDTLRHDFVEIDLLEFFREVDARAAIALKKEYGCADAYARFTCDIRS